jgi:D-sedoheptulose 7-phosphate isomerase
VNNIEKIFVESQIKTFATGYFAYVYELLRALDLDKVNAFMQTFDEARMNGNTIFLAGNGGSASTASHMGNDIGMAVAKVNDEEHQYRVVSLTNDMSLITAVANDYGYEDIFVKQLEIQYRKGDVLVVLSASGNSPNVVKATDWVLQRKGKVLGLLGFDGGLLKEKCEIGIVVNTPKGEYGPVEDVHLILTHMLTSWIHMRFKKQSAYDFQL